MAGPPHHINCELSDWQSFWDIATPREGANAIIEIYGTAAADAVLRCLAAARNDNRDEDFHFWTAVLGYIKSADRPGETVPSRD